MWEGKLPTPLHPPTHPTTLWQQRTWAAACIPAHQHRFVAALAARQARHLPLHAPSCPSWRPCPSCCGTKVVVADSCEGQAGGGGLAHATVHRHGGSSGGVQEAACCTCLLELALLLLLEILLLLLLAWAKAIQHLQRQHREHAGGGRGKMDKVRGYQRVDSKPGKSGSGGVGMMPASGDQAKALHLWQAQNSSPECTEQCQLLAAPSASKCHDATQQLLGAAWLLNSTRHGPAGCGPGPTTAPSPEKKRNESTGALTPQTLAALQFNSTHKPAVLP